MNEMSGVRQISLHVTLDLITYTLNKHVLNAKFSLNRFDVDRADR